MTAWSARVRYTPPPDFCPTCSQADDDAAARAEALMGSMSVEVPPEYPVQGPEVTFRGRTLRFVMGSAAVPANEQEAASLFFVSWTPAQRLSDAVITTLELVQQVELQALVGAGAGDDSGAGTPDGAAGDAGADAGPGYECAMSPP